MLFVKKLDPRATLPTCAHPGEDLGYDLYALEDVILRPGKVTKVRTGIAVEHIHATWGSSLYCQAQHYIHVKDGLLIRDRSSMAFKGIIVSGGVVDTGYRGEVIVLMTLVGGIEYDKTDRPLSRPFSYLIEAGNKIAQMIPVPVLTSEGVMGIDAFTEEITARGEKGFGSSGR